MKLEQAERLARAARARVRNAELHQVWANTILHIAERESLRAQVEKEYPGMDVAVRQKKQGLPGWEIAIKRKQDNWTFWNNAPKLAKDS